LSSFAEPRFIKKVLEVILMPDNLNELTESLGDQEKGRTAVVLFKALLLHGTAHPLLFPPLCESTADVLSLVPLAWMVECEGWYSPDVYIAEASRTIKALGIDRPIGRNPEPFRRLIGLLTKFREIPLELVLSLTKVISMMLAIAPDLINADLAAACALVIGSLREVESFEPATESTPDSPQLRAAIFVEFAKEIHGTFIAAELALTASLFTE
jgi:hypothetical protein